MAGWLFLAKQPGGVKQYGSEEAYGAGPPIGAAGIGEVELMGVGRGAGIRCQYGLTYDLEALIEQGSLLHQEVARPHVEQGEGGGGIRGGKHLKLAHTALQKIREYGPLSLPTQREATP